MNIIERVKNIVLNPKEEWGVISQETTTNSQLLVNYLLILAFIPAIGQLVRFGFVGYSLPFGGHLDGSLALGIRYAAISYITTVLGVFVSAYLIDMLAPNFESVKDSSKALQLVVYAYTPFLVLGIFNAIPGLAFLTIFGLYGLYIMYLGFTPMMQTPTERVASYFVVSLLVTIAVFLILGIILSKLFIPGAFNVPGMGL